VRHIEVTDAPGLTEAQAEANEETPAERAKRMLGSVRGAKSIITSPAHPNVVSPGDSLVKGIAWSGRGKIARVDISTDGGKTWKPATLIGEVFPKCQTRFAYRWNWDGREAMLMSRAEDETGNVQLSLEEVRAGIEADTLQNQNNHIRAWKVGADGSVVFGLT
jgi:sulfane dehydrogenase subunit SoxC